MNERMEQFVKKCVFHYAGGGQLQQASAIMREFLPPNKKNMNLPTKVLEAYHFAVEIKREEQTVQGAISMLVYHGAKEDEAQYLLDTAVNSLKNHYGQLHYDTTDINCPKCDWSKEVGFHYLGKQIACPTCYSGFTVA